MKTRLGIIISFLAAVLLAGCNPPRVDDSVDLKARVVAIKTSEEHKRLNELFLRLKQRCYNIDRSVAANRYRRFAGEEKSESMMRDIATAAINVEGNLVELIDNTSDPDVRKRLAAYSASINKIATFALDKWQDDDGSRQFIRLVESTEKVLLSPTIDIGDGN